MKVLELRNVSKTYRTGSTRVHALVEADLSVEPGELVAIMGPSGSGKSTLLAIAGALEPADRGEVRVDGTLLTAMSARKRAALRRRAIGYVFQDYNLLPGLTAAENAALSLELDGVSPRRARLAALRVLDELDMGDRAGKYPADLSGGDRQRVAIARAMAAPSGKAAQLRLLLADEPSGALDSVTAESVLRLVRRACREGLAGVLVTHEAQVAAWADRVIFLSDGRVIDSTPPPPDPELLLAAIATVR